MNKVLIYPYSDEIAFLLEGNYFNDDIDVRELVGLKGSKYIGKTIECANKKLTVRDNFENHLNKVDTVWFVDSMEKERNELDFSICNKIEKCIELNKTIWYSRKKLQKRRKSL